MLSGWRALARALARAPTLDDVSRAKCLGWRTMLTPAGAIPLAAGTTKLVLGRL